MDLPVPMARQVHYDLCLAQHLGAWCNLHATTEHCRVYMHSLQCGQLGEGQYFWAVLVNEDVTCRTEDVGGATLWEINKFSSFGGEKGKDGL